jgi:RND family efflux transporter MFP subunit
MLARPVQVRAVHFAALSQPRVLVGTLRARIESDRSFRVAGKIASRAADVGTRVKAGDLLARLDETDFRLARESAEAELAAARSSERQAQLDRDRIAELRAKGWSTEQAFDKQKAAVDEAAGRLKRAGRQVELAQNSQSYTELRAEGAGTVISVVAETGQVVAAGQPVFRIAADGDREVLVAIPEQDLALARDAQAEVSLWSDPDKHFKARLRELSPNADSATRTFLARYTVEGLAPDAALGMTATLTLSRAQDGKVARIPLSAILNEGGGSEVFVLDKTTGELGRKPVKVLSFDAQEALIEAGLKDGELVVTLGIHTLRSGQKARALAEAKS